MCINKKLLQGSLLFAFFLLISFQLQAQSQFKVLLITETAGWHHGSISNGIEAVEKLAGRHNFEVDVQQNAIPITEESLKKYEAVIFLSTTGDIFNEEEQEAIEHFIQSGKGYVGIHAAADTEYDWPWYNKLVGRMFHIHPAQQTAKLRVMDHNFPGLEAWPDTMLWTDEWYEFQKEEAENLHYLVRVDENTYNPVVTWKNRDKDENGKMMDRHGEGMGKMHPVVWYHTYDGGRAFYTALGHIPAIWENQYFLDMLYGGIYYAATGKGIEKE
ncbi:MAG: ThuA domain-containing protein [Salegentibacter sp.]